MTSSTRVEKKCLCTNRLVIHILDAATIVLIVGFQGGLLNCYLINHYEQSIGPYFYFLGDILTIIVFAGTLITSYNYLTRKKATEDQIEKYAKSFKPTHLMQEIEVYLPRHDKNLGALPFSYISWLVYVTILISKIIVIFKAPDLVENLSDDNHFGPNLLKVR